MAVWTNAQLSAHSNTAKIVWDYFKQKGLNDVACSAILANIERESHFDTGAVEGNGEGHGLVQWSYGRKTALLNYAKQQNKSWTDIYLQLDFMWLELTSTEKSTLKMLQTATNVENATVMFEKLYERAGVVAKEDRIHYGNYWFNQFKNTDITTNTKSVSSNSTNTATEAKKNNDSENFHKYFNAGYLEISDELSVAMMDELVKVDPLRRVEPLHRLDYIEYGHRYYNSLYNLTLGDCCFVIPPQAISIMSESNGQELVTLRQENTQKIKNGYSKRTISIELVFHGYNQINGYQVESPEGYYYVDGLRQLLAQFKCTPFLPIQNYTINNTYNIHTVALQSIVCSTVDGFPDMMIANLTLQEVDLYPYIEAHTMFFSDFIDWDLFRFYYQRQLTENHEYGKLQSIPVDKSLNKFKISVLNDSIFSSDIDYDIDSRIWYDEDYNLKGEKLNFTFYDIVLDRIVAYSDDDGNFHTEKPSKEHPSNFTTYIDSEIDNVHIASFQCGYSNILTNIQMAEQSHPTVQYMGGMDTIFNITFETTNEDIVTALEKCNIINNTITRDHKNCSSLGFVKLESELVELFGSKFVMIDNVTTHTVPDFPGLFICQINCVSFDIYQKETEGIRGLSPFEGSNTNINGTGTKENAISQTPSGLREKVKQDVCVEHKLRTITELYPDLKLPTYQEVDEVISKIKAFRYLHANRDGSPLGEYPIDKYPRTPQRMLHGISKISNLDIDEYGFVTNVPDVIDNSDWYEGFVDPDFYVFYPETYKKMMEETKEDRTELGINYKNPKPEPKTTTIIKTKITSNEITDSDISNYDYELYSQGATELQLQFIALARNKLGKVYSNDNSGYYNRTGPNAYDCSGLIGQCLYEMGVIANPKITTSQVGNLINAGVFKQKWKVANINNINELVAHANPGDLLHIYGNERGSSMGHIAIYIGNNKIIHASSGKNQVCEVNVYKGFLRVLEVPALLEGAVTKQEVTSNATVTVNMNLRKGDSGDEVKQLQKLLNILNDADLELDGKYGSLTEQAVKDFQTKYEIKIDGIVGPETSAKLTEVANKYITQSSSKTTITSGADANYITESELMAIAKTIANIQLGKPYAVQVALAQLIYDRLTDKKAKYGNLNNVLNSSIFKGQYSKTLPASSTAYLAAKNVFCNGERAFNNQLVNYLGLDSGNTDYLNLDNQYDRAGTLGDFTFWTNNNATSDKKYTLTDDDTDNKTISDTTIQETTEINTGVTGLDASFAKYFGKPVLVKSSEMNSDSGWLVNAFEGKTGNQEEAYQENYNTDIQTLMTAFVNQCEYSGKGRLVKAFPTYLFCIVDEDGNWLDGRKLWANYYALRSLVEIQVASYDDSPISTATVTVTNSYGNLDTLPPNAFYYSPLNDSEYNDFQKWLYKTFGMLPGFGPKLTETLVDQKNIIYDSMVIRAGSRMHLRMGYGSDPLSLPIVMNGYISDLQVGDITQFVCVSDGVELTNGIISDNPRDTNGIFEAQESSNICINMLTARQSWLNVLNEKWGEPNKYGIEHFGLYMSEHVDTSELLGLPSEWGDWDYESITNEEDTWYENLSDAFVNALKLVGNTAETVFDTALTLGRGVADNFVKSWREIQYDIVKNIYRSSYDGSLAMYTPFWGFIDDEKNLCFNLYNKSPWDAIQMAVMNAPEYIGMPLYHQFESRLFFGLPWFLAKYRYNLINGEMYEEAKTYAQCHFVDSLSEIIDNQMITTSRDVYTNDIVMYTLGKSPKASPTLYSDKSISFSQQSTKIFDSSVTQNIIGPDQIWEWVGIDIGKMGACRVGISQLLWNWAKAYQGDILILGDGGISPNDYIYLNDRFNNVNGLCTARTVIHSLSARTGFVTTITPGMIGMSTEQHSQAIITLSNMITVGGAFSYYMSVKKIIKDNADKVSEWYNTCKDWVFWTSLADAGIRVGLASAAIYKTVNSVGNIYDMVKGLKYGESLKELKRLGGFLRNSVNIYKRMKQAGQTFKIAKITTKAFKLGSTSFKALFATGGGTAGTAAGPLGTAAGFVVGFAIGLLVDIALTAIIDYFRWNNVLVLLPLMHNNNPYAPILSGERLLITGSSNTTVDHENPEESGDTIFEIISGIFTGDDDPGEESNMSKQPE